MARVQISIEISVSPAVLWEELRHIDRHVNWMNDAVSITFRSDQREGIGTTFECLTKIGPLTTKDIMTITAWKSEEVMGVAHQGLVTGSGIFTLEPTSLGTRMTWTEDLLFPWWGLGQFGALCARPVFRWIWKKNLSNLKKLVEK